jgi:hypothetical protein
MSAPSLADVAAKRWDYFRRYVVVDLGQDRQDGFSTYGAGSLKRYVEGEIEVHLHLLAWVDGFDGVPGHLCCTYETFGRSADSLEMNDVEVVTPNPRLK